jgi:hypothetical protein
MRALIKKGLVELVWTRTSASSQKCAAGVGPTTGFEGRNLYQVQTRSYGSDYNSGKHTKSTIKQFCIDDSSQHCATLVGACSHRDNRNLRKRDGDEERNLARRVWSSLELAIPENFNR